VLNKAISHERLLFVKHLEPLNPEQKHYSANLSGLLLLWNATKRHQQQLITTVLIFRPTASVILYNF